MELLKTSWPFDSDPNVTYDDLGYPILDRAVGADTLQRTFDKFFSDGVFSTSDFRISAASGLSVNLQPGMCIINGGMAGWWDEPKVVALSATAPQWLTHYAIFLRYDNNDDMRGIYLRIDASAAGASVPEPVSAANVTELRIGYVTVPANATDLSGATFHNEVGTSMAPITVPLFDIDPIPILEDLRERADAAYQAYYDLLISAVDGTTAGHLQAQIDELKENQFTEDDIDPLALRKEMGLGDTLGVLGIPYGGTGESTAAGLFNAVMANTAHYTWSKSVANEWYPTGTISLKAGKYLVVLLHNEADSTSSYYESVELFLGGEKIAKDANTEGGPFSALGFLDITSDKTYTLKEGTSSYIYSYRYYANPRKINLMFIPIELY